MGWFDRLLSTNIDRRDFTKNVARLAAMFSAISLNSGDLNPETLKRRVEKTSDQEVKRDLDFAEFFLDAFYGIKVEIPTNISFEEGYTLEPIERNVYLRDVLAKFCLSISKFPPALIKNKIKTLVVHDKIYGNRSNKAYVGFYTEYKKELIITNESVNLDLNIFHEVGHAIFNDPQVALDFMSEVYGNNSKTTEDTFYQKGYFDKHGTKSFPPLGFISNYSKEGVYEDIVEVFSYLIGDKKLLDRIIDIQNRKGNDLLLKKVNFIKRKFLEMSGLTEDYFLDLDKKRIDIKYWQNRPKFLLKKD